MRADSKSEKILEVVFTILLCLSLVCFAGIPALENESDLQASTISK